MFAVSTEIDITINLKLAGAKQSDTLTEEGLCNDLNKTQRDPIVSKFTPETSLLYTQKCNASIPNCKKLYIKLIQDKEFPISMQNKMARNLKTDMVKEIISGHLPILFKTNKTNKIAK